MDLVVMGECADFDSNIHTYIYKRRERKADECDSTCIYISVYVCVCVYVYIYIGEDAWWIYHEGYRRQVRSWPVNPLESAAKWITARHEEWKKRQQRDTHTSVKTTAASNESTGVKKRRQKRGGGKRGNDDKDKEAVNERKEAFVVADFGCGEAELASRLGTIPSCTFHSFDLVKANAHVTRCSMTNVPLEAESVDAAVFCLSLMGTDYGDALLEARRVLCDGGGLFVAEVRSRFAGDGHATSTHSTDSTVLRGFLSALKSAGFVVVPRECDLSSNSHFFSVACTLRKSRASAAKSIQWPALKACTYKKR